jgi:hypothetical protein
MSDLAGPGSALHFATLARSRYARRVQQDPRPKPNDFYFYCHDCGVLCGLLEAGCEDGEDAWCDACTKKLWADDAPPANTALGLAFLAPNIRRYDAISQRTRLSFQRAAKAAGTTAAAVRKKMLSQPAD